MANNDVREKILSTIDFLLVGIDEHSKRDMDLMVSQTIKALSEAYKNLEEDNNG